MNSFFGWRRGSSPRMTHTLTWSYPAAVAGSVDAGLHGHERRLITVAADDVDELCRIRRQPAPTVRLRHFPGVALVEAHAGEHGAAGLLDARGQAHAICVGLDLRAGDNQQRDGGAAAIEQAGH